VFLLVLAFIVVPLIELYVIVEVAGSIGIVPTLLILVADAVLGSMLLRHQGRAAWIRFNRALGENRMPHREVLDGVLIIFGGALLLTPGFLTDVVGLILLIPPTRAAVRAFMGRFVRGRLAMGPRAAMWGYGRVRDRGATRRPAPGAPGSPPPRAHPAPDPNAAWEDALFPGHGRHRGPDPDETGRSSPDETGSSRSPLESAERPRTIEGTGHEIRDDEELPPADEGPPAR
jgi:UPF0716 protein FxsA